MRDYNSYHWSHTQKNISGSFQAYLFFYLLKMLKGKKTMTQGLQNLIKHHLNLHTCDKFHVNLDWMSPCK